MAPSGLYARLCHAFSGFAYFEYFEYVVYQAEIFRFRP